MDSLPVYLILLLSVLQLEVAQADHDAPILAQPGCNSSCGNVIIPFPFGIGANCSLDRWFEIKCKAPPNSDGSMPIPFLSAFDLEVIEVSFHSFMSTVKVRIPPLHACSSADTLHPLNSTDFRGSPYNYSARDNVFIMSGCPASAVLVNESKEIMAGCGTVCHRHSSAIPPNSCYGVQCCQTPLPSSSYSGIFSPLQFYQIDFNDESSGEKGQHCLEATLIESDSVNQYAGNLTSSNSSSSVPVVLKWNLGSKIMQDSSPRAICEDADIGLSFCDCKDGYYGNPYIPNGCQVPQECKNCRGSCSGRWDLEGKLFPGTSYYCEKRPILKLATTLGENYCINLQKKDQCGMGLTCKSADQPGVTRVTP